MKKKRLLALLLALAMLLPLPGMMGEVHAESQQSPLNVLLITLWSKPTTSPPDVLSRAIPMP